MDNVKSKKLTALISKLTIAANKAVAKKAVQAEHESRKHYSITGLNVNSNYDQRGAFGHVNFMRSQL